MKKRVFFGRKLFVFGMMITISFSLSSCLKSDSDLIPADAIQLFKKEKYKGEFIEIAGPRDCASLNKIPNIETEWNGQAKSLRVGSGLDVIVWNKEDFQGDSLFLKADTEKPKLDFEIRSLRIQQPE